MKLLAKSTVVLFGLILAASALTSIEAVAPARAADQAGDQKAASMSQDERAIHDQADRFAAAFGAGEAKVIADLCTDDCTLTNAEGQRFTGHDAILKLYERCFKDYGHNPAFVNLESLTFPAPDVCVEEGTLFVSKLNNENRYSVVHVKRDGKWLMMRITESPYNPQPSEALRPLDWLVGHWTIKDRDKTVYLKVHTIANQNFLVMRFSNDPGETPSADELQLIGWSFKSRDIVSWHFGQEGGFGFGHWRRMGSNWIIDTRGVRRDGIQTLASYKLDFVDNDHFRWESVNREAAGEQLPNLPPVDVTRQK